MRPYFEHCSGGLIALIAQSGQRATQARYPLLRRRAAARPKAY